MGIYSVEFLASTKFSRGIFSINGYILLYFIRSIINILLNLFYNEYKFSMNYCVYTKFIVV